MSKHANIDVSGLQEMLVMIRKAKKYLLKEMRELEEGEQTLVRQIAAAAEATKGGAADKYIQAQLSASTELLKSINHRKKCERHRIMMQEGKASTAPHKQ